MARFTGGWIKVHRSVLEHWVGEEIDTLGFFVKLIAMANIKDSKHVRHGNFISVKRGDILTSSPELAASTGRSRCWVEKRLDLLESDGTITQQKSSAGRIITICNYSDYQDNDKEEKQQTLQQKGSPEAAPRQQKSSPETHSKEGKNNKKVRKNILPTASPSVDDKPHGSVLWDRYSELYEKRHTVKPARSAKENSLCAQIIKQIGLEDALKTVEFYLASDQHAMYRHELPYFKQHIQRLRTDALSSKTTSLIEKYGLKAL